VDVLRRKVLRGVPPALESVAAAYAVMPIDIESRRFSEETPVVLDLGGVDDGGGSVSIDNRLDVALSGCRLHLDGLSPMELRGPLEPGAAGSFTVFEDGDSLPGGGIDGALLSVTGQMRTGGGVLVCHIAGPLRGDVAFEGAESQERWDMVRFVF
jgi:hypothetical protein